MSPNIRPKPSSPSDRVRRLWLPFEKSTVKSRSVIDHRVKALLDKADKEYGKTPPDGRVSPDQHSAYKASLAKKAMVPHFEQVRTQWEKILAQSGLRAEDWTDMSDEEMASVLNVLGNLEDDIHQDTAAAAVQSPAQVPATRPPPTTYATRSAQPLAPSLSRSSNVSTASSYAFVDPSEFHSEDEDFFPSIAASHDLTSDDDDAAPAHRFDAWSSDSSSHHSLEASSSSRFPRPAVLQTTTARKLTSASRQAAHQEQPNGSKAKAVRQSYVGPIVNDPNEALSDEEDFERFKMNIRIQKIVEFHQAAAQADIDLAVAIYKDRKAQNNDVQEVSSKVTNHQKRMFQLQLEKEEERKKIVAAERSKRRSELRRRPGRSGTLIAPIPSLPPNPSWLMGFEEQVAEDLRSNLSLDNILSTNLDVQEGNIDRLLQQILPSSSPDDDDGNFAQPLSQNGSYVPNGLHHHPNGWAPASTSVTASSTASQGPNPKRLSSVHSQKKRKVKKPSLFGDDSNEEEEEGQEEESGPPHRAETAAQPSNPFMDADTGEFLSSQLASNPDIASAFAQWGIPGVEPEVPRSSVSVAPGAWGMGQFGQMAASSSSASWNTRQVVQTPTVDNPNPWGLKDVRSTPVAPPPIASRRKLSFSATPAPSSSLQSPFNSFLAAERSEQPMSLKMMAAYNSANVNEKKAIMASSIDDRKSVLEEPLKGPSPPRPSPPANGSPASAAALAGSTTAPPPTALQPKVENVPGNNKRLTKKQRQVQKKVGTSIGMSSSTENQTMEAASPAPELMTFEQPEVPQPNGFTRLRKESFSGWNEMASTPRPASKIPAHLQDRFGMKSEITPQVPSQMTDPQRVVGPSGSSTIKAPQLKAASRPAWSIFSPQEVGPSKLQRATPLLSVNRDHRPYLPGSFDVDDNDDRVNGVNADNDGLDEPPLLPARFSTLAAATSDNLTSSTHLKQPSPARGQNPSPNDMNSLPALKAKAVTPNMQQQQQSVPPPIGAKKGKNKKGKKKATVEEVADEEQDSRGERLPIDSRFILEEQNVHEPKPSVPPTMFESIIGYGGEDEGMSGSSSFATPSTSTAAGSPPDLFDGDLARFAAASKQLQADSARVENELRGTAWGSAASGTRDRSPAALGASSRSSSSTAEVQAPAFWSWGQTNASDRKKSNNGENNNNVIPKTVFSPALKISKAPAGF